MNIINIFLSAILLIAVALFVIFIIIPLSRAAKRN